jgi:hypothetical protein
MNYPELVQEILKSHLGNDLEDETEVQLIFDTERNHFLVLHLGWQEEK